MEQEKRASLASEIMPNTSGKILDNIWHEKPDLIRRFLEQRPDYEQLCAEVGYILTKRLKDYEVEGSTVIWRAKSLNSFIEKIQRKDYGNPFDDIKDFAGIRIIYLYKQDKKKIEKIIRAEFDVKEKVDKLGEKDPDRFGYLAMHFIANLSSKSSGARYEHLKNLSFEIQVRTVLQDAWAIIDHNLAYKKESDIPKHLQRGLMRIAGMFELADEEFNRIQRSIQSYEADLRETSLNDVEQFLQNDLNLSSFLEYVSWRFKDMPRDRVENQCIKIFEGIDRSKYSTLFQLNEAIENTDSLRIQVSDFLEEQQQKDFHFAANQFVISLAIVDEEFRTMRGFPNYVVEAIEKFNVVN